MTPGPPIPTDPYWKLRPTPPTPEDEVCHCERLECVMLRDFLGENPLYCVLCNGEVFPERIGFDEQLSEDIANWRFVHGALYLLWLDSSEYELWAADKLSDPHGRVNAVGLELVQRLSATVPSFYWWFLDVGAEDYSPPERCPLCNGAIEVADLTGRATCTPCRIVF